MRRQRGRSPDGRDRTASVSDGPGRYLVTGCSGAGKSTLIEELAARGCQVIREPGRRLIARGITPTDDIEVFLKHAAMLAREDLAEVSGATAPVVFDRGLLDALAGLERLNGPPVERQLGDACPYERTVFFAQCWPEIFRNDEGRLHPLDAAKVEADHLQSLLPRLGYELAILPQVSVGERADFVLETIAQQGR